MGVVLCLKSKAKFTSNPHFSLLFSYVQKYTFFCNDLRLSITVFYSIVPILSFYPFKSLLS